MCYYFFIERGDFNGNGYNASDFGCDKRIAGRSNKIRAKD